MKRSETKVRLTDCLALPEAWREGGSAAIDGARQVEHLRTMLIADHRWPADVRPLTR